MTRTSFHKEVADYYDQDVRLGFESRAGQNPLLQRIRDDFREVTVKYSFNNILEIGCGPGFDVAWFAARYPEKEVTGIDISPKMIQLAEKRIESEKLENARVRVLDERQLIETYGTDSFDLVYVYFGALNTVSDLGKTAKDLFRLIKPGGYAVLTFVNKWYLREMFVQALKLNPRLSLARIGKVWGGYSPSRFLPSKCYSPSQIKRAFDEFELVERKGYSIFFPAWYNPEKLRGNEVKADRLWKLDQKLQHTILWSKGEYTLFVFRKS
jgi:SAM-dependent methyltransferase